MAENSGSYFKIYSYMITDLKLSGNELIILALIHNFTTTTEYKCFYGSQAYIGKCIGVSRQTANSCINDLIRKGYIEKLTDKKHQKKECYVSKILIPPVKKLDSKLSKKPTANCQKTLHNINKKRNNDNISYSKEAPSFDIMKSPDFLY